MKLRNTTEFDTHALRVMIRAAVREVYSAVSTYHDRQPVWLRVRRDLILKHCDVWIRQRHGRRSHTNTGCATLNGTMMRITTTGDAVGFLFVLRHEVWHLFDVEHSRMPPTILHMTEAARRSIADIYATLLAQYAPGGILPPRPQKPARAKPTADERAGAELARITAGEKRWTTKLRRAQTAIAKLRKRRRYYERQIAAKRSERKEP